MFIAGMFLTLDKQNNQINEQSRMIEKIKSETKIWVYVTTIPKYRATYTNLIESTYFNDGSVERRILTK